MKRLAYSALLLAVLALSGCQTGLPDGIQAARVAMSSSILREPPGDYFIGRRYYKQDYKFWGYVRNPGQPWSTAQLVMLNEQQRLAPDRAAGVLGSDHNFEYRLTGRFSGDTVYEPASNSFYPEFVLSGYQLRSETPVPILRTRAADPSEPVIGRPY